PPPGGGGGPGPGLGGTRGLGIRLYGEAGGPRWVPRPLVRVPVLAFPARPRPGRPPGRDRTASGGPSGGDRGIGWLSPYQAGHDTDPRPGPPRYATAHTRTDLGAPDPRPGAGGGPGNRGRRRHPGAATARQRGRRLADAVEGGRLPAVPVVDQPYGRAVIVGTEGVAPPAEEFHMPGSVEGEVAHPRVSDPDQLAAAQHLGRCSRQ